MPANSTPPAQAIRDASQAMLDEFMAADIVVIGAPMYNFTVPSQLKAWIDRIVIPGKTFKYGAHGPEGLVHGKRVIVAIARGGFYGPESAAVSAEHAESYLRSGFGFLGVTDLEFVLAEGVSAGEESKTKAMSAARDAIGPTRRLIARQGANRRTTRKNTEGQSKQPSPVWSVDVRAP